jgi:hypothetical protein
LECPEIGIGSWLYGSRKPKQRRFAGRRNSIGEIHDTADMRKSSLAILSFLLQDSRNQDHVIDWLRMKTVPVVHDQEKTLRIEKALTALG